METNEQMVGNMICIDYSWSWSSGVLTRQKRVGEVQCPTFIICYQSFCGFYKVTLAFKGICLLCFIHMIEIAAKQLDALIEIFCSKLELLIT